MTELKNLTSKQLAVLRDLFAGELDESAVLEKHKVRDSLYAQWQADERFCEEFERRLGALNRQSRLIIARYATLAAAKLVQLTESSSAETARKACLDIISLGTQTKADTNTTKPQDDDSTPQTLSPETASRILAALAEEKPD